MILAVSDQVWLAGIALLTLIFGIVNNIVNAWLANRNRNVTQVTTQQLSKALAENTALTQKASDVADKTHALVKSVVPDS